MNNRWISVKEKLPEIGKTVLCGVENVGILLNLCEYTKKGFRPANDLRIDDRVTHWQELPRDPYETKKPIKELPNLPKSTENLSKIKNKDEWLNEVRGNEGLGEKFKYAITWMGSDLDGKIERCVEIAKQYSGSKLSELEKLVSDAGFLLSSADEQNLSDELRTGISKWMEDFYRLQSLKQQS